MDSTSSSFPNWNDLPNEIKLKIIKNADKNSRLALKACSLNDNQLVSSIPSRQIHKMRLLNEEGGTWNIDIIRTMYGCKTSLTSNTFEEFQKKLKKEIENCDHIDYMEMHQKETPNQLRFTKSRELLKVRRLVFSPDNRDVSNILSQVDPSSLKYLELYQNGLHRDIFEFPQLKRVHHLHVRGAHITDAQILDMENPELLLSGTENITLAGINQYIKKCLFNLDSKPVYFRIELRQAAEQLFQDIEAQRISEPLEHVLSEPEIFQVRSRLNNYQLEIKYCPEFIEGRTICRDQNQHPERQHDSEAQNSFKSVDCVTIENDRFTIVERNTAPVTHISDSTDDLQEKLIEEMNKINYIKHLKLQDASLNWQLCSFNKQATIGQLSVFGGSFNSDFLLQIEPIHLKEISINVGSNDGEIYKMPQFIHARKLDILNCWMKNEDLIRMNAIRIIIGPGRPTILTNSGINKFIKKILTNFKMHDYNFEICHCGGRNSAGRLEDLDILSSQRISRTATRIIVNSPFPEFKLELLDRRRMIIGKRITAEDAEKSRQVDAGNDDSDDSDSDDSDSDDSYPDGVYSDDND